MRRLLRYLSISIGTISLSLFLLVVVIGYTQPGLQLSLYFLQKLTPGTLHIDQASGQLFNRIQLGTVEYHHQDFHIQLTQVTFVWCPSALLRHSLSIRQFTAEQVRVNPSARLVTTTIEEIFPLQFGLRASGDFSWQSPFANKIQIELIPIEDAQTPINGDIQLQSDGHQWQWNATLTQPWPITIKGELQDQWDASWQATMGQIHSQGNITGARDHPIISAHQQMEQFQWGDSFVEQAMLRLYFEWNTHGALKSELNIHHLTHGEIHFDHLQLLLDGVVSDHEIKIQLQQAEQQWQTLITGQYVDFIWQGNFKLLDYQHPDQKNWRLERIGTLTVAPWDTPMTAQLLIPDLAWVSQINSDITHVSGQLRAEVNITKGRASDSSVQIAIEHGQATLPALDITLKPFNLTATKAFHQPWKFNGQVTSGEGTLTLESTVNPQVIQITGQQFTVMNTDELFITVSPKLEVHWNESPIKITGEILIPTASIHPLDYSQTVHLPNDVVFVEQSSTQSSSPLQWQADVTVTLGDKVTIDFAGIQARLEGNVHVVETSEQPTHATGQIDFLEGQFQYLNQTLKLDYGHIYYTNSLLDEPTVRVQASKELHTNINRFSIMDSKLVVGVRVEGTISDPKVSLFSNPAGLSQSDILSLLVLGKTISEASSGLDSKNNSALLVQAAGTLGLESSNTVQQIRDSFGIDQLSLETEKQNEVGSIGNVLEKTSLVIGKALSPRLFISYHINLLGQQNRFSGNIIRLRYLLRPKLILQTETDGKDNAVDLLYIIELK